MRVSNNTVGSVLDLYGAELRERYGAGEARAIARSVFRESFGWDILHLEDHKGDTLSESELLKVWGPLKRLRKGEPLQYVLGHAWFMGLKLHVTSAVLIPRPETEELVALIAEQDRTFKRIVDVGTGSGCIAIALKRIHPNAEVTGVDVSADALSIARMNGAANGVEVEWKMCDILRPAAELTEGCDLVISNPPYVPRTEEAMLDEHVRDHEPHLALFVDDADPLLFYRAIAKKALVALVPGGELWFEGHYRHALEVGDLLSRIGYRDVHVLSDLSGSPRFIHAIR